MVEIGVTGKTRPDLLAERTVIALERGSPVGWIGRERPMKQAIRLVAEEAKTRRAPWSLFVSYSGDGRRVAMWSADGRHYGSIGTLPRRP